MRCDEAQDPPVLIPAPCMPKATPANECGDGSRKKRRPVGKLRAPDQNRDQEQKREVLEEWTEFAEQEKNIGYTFVIPATIGKLYAARTLVDIGCVTYVFVSSRFVSKNH